MKFMKFVSGMKFRTSLNIEMFCGRIDYDFEKKSKNKDDRNENEFSVIDYNSDYGRNHNYTYGLGNGSRKVLKSEPWKIDEW